MNRQTGNNILKFSIEKAFLNENYMKAATAVALAGVLASTVLLATGSLMSPLLWFEKLTKLAMILAVFTAFVHFHWDALRGLMGGLLLCLMYQEGFAVLGQLWGETTDFDAYLIMGVQGSLYLAISSMSFLMTIIITVNHFIIDYSNIGNKANVVFNQITIVFKILLYVGLFIINFYIELPTLRLVNAGVEYIGDLAIVVILICIETQLDNFKSLRHDLLKDKKRKAAGREPQCAEESKVAGQKKQSTEESKATVQKQQCAEKKGGEA